MASREASAAASSGGDTIEDHDDIKPSIADLDHEDSAADVPAVATPSSIRSAKKTKIASLKKPRPKKGSIVFMNEGLGDGTEDEAGKSKEFESPAPEGDRAQGTAVGTRRQANGTVGSVYSGSKVRHIKKADGTPLWRKEIQYEFLRLVIEDTTQVFTRISDRKKNCNFADIYIDCMARSSKTSKILKDRLQIDRQAAQNMAMICLLVNVGRMNTTLNFFPEMRAQLRTYHSIPSLQAYKSQKDYKSLQDAPRLKSILKGASEDTEEPRTLATVKAAAVPRTNPVNLIFVLSQCAADVAQLHFIDKVDFFDLAIRTTITSKSRARAFLWLMWWYLESETHDRESALNNPFGPGEFKEDQDPNDPNEVPQLVPALVNITEEEGDAENVDPEEEKLFAEKMTKERRRIMLEERQNETPNQPSEYEHKGVKRLKKNAREFEDDSDVDSMRASPGFAKSPAGEGVMGMMSGRAGTAAHGEQADSIEDDWEALEAHPGRGRYKRIKGKNTPSRSKNSIGESLARGRGGVRSSGLGFDRGTPDTVGARGTPQPFPPGAANHPIISQYDTARSRKDGDSAMPAKSRARTGYQRLLEEHKQSRIEWLLQKKRRDVLKEAKQTREGESWLQRAAFRIQALDATYDSEDGDDSNSSYLHEFSLNALNAPFQNGSSNIPKTIMGTGGLIAQHVETRGLPVTPSTQNQYLPFTSLEPDDFGEEVETWLKVFRRAKCRLETWSGERDHEIFLARKAGKTIVPVKDHQRRSKRDRPDRLSGGAEMADATMLDDDPIPAAPPPSSNRATARALNSRRSLNNNGTSTSSRSKGPNSRSVARPSSSTSALQSSARKAAISTSSANNNGNGNGNNASTITGHGNGDVITSNGTGPVSTRRPEMSLNDEITLDLLAERSDDDEDDLDDLDADDDRSVDDNGSVIDDILDDLGDEGGDDEMGDGDDDDADEDMDDELGNRNGNGVRHGAVNGDGDSDVEMD